MQMFSNLNCSRDKFFIGFLSFATLCFVIILGGLLSVSQKSFDAISDAPEYSIVGKMILEGAGSKCYDADKVIEMRHRLFPHLRERSLAVISPPPALVLFTPLGLLDENAVRTFYLPLSALLLTFSVLMLWRTFRLSFRNGLF